MRNEKGQFMDGEAGKDNRFVPGQKPWNKGKRGYMGANATSFKKGSIPPQRLPKGTIRTHYKHGKVEQVSINIDWKGNRKPKNIYAWYVWEVVHQQDRPQGYVIYHLNGDKEDNRLDNLMPITRSELMRMNH